MWLWRPRTTNRPRILKQADEDIAVISPIRKAAKRQPDGAAPVSRIPHYTLEQALGLVPTPLHLHGNDIDEMIREANEERAPAIDTDHVLNVCTFLTRILFSEMPSQSLSCSTTILPIS